MTANTAERQTPAPIKLDRGNVAPTLSANALSLLGSGDVGHYTGWVPNDTLLETVLKPGFWANHTNRLRKGSLVTVMRHDMSLVVGLRVLNVEVGMVTMRLAYGKPEFASDENIAIAAGGNFDETSLELPAGYKVATQTNLGGYYANTPQGESLSKGARGLSREQATRMAIDHFNRANTPNT
jgi:hypothetical protein